MGFRVLDALAARWRAGSWREHCLSLVAEAAPRRTPVLLAKPLTYMNRSGEALALLLAGRTADPPRLIVVHDDLDLPFGELRIRRAGGAGGHNGIRSILACLGSGDFARVKVGIGRPEDRGAEADYVLSPFTDAEEEVLPLLLLRASDAAESVLFEGPERAMNRFHSPEREDRRRHP